MNDSCSMGIDYGFGEPGHSEKKKLPWLSGDITISISGVGWIVSPKKMCSFSYSTHECYLFGNITFADITYLEIWPLHMSLRILRADHSGLEWALNQVTSILPRQKKGICEDKHIERKATWKTEIETFSLKPGKAESASHQKKARERHGTDSPLEPTWWHLDFWPPKP